MEHKETMATGAAAALAGGVTTVCEMPNTIPPTVTVAALADKVRRSEKLTVNSEKIKMDLRFFFGATEPAHLITLQELWTGSSAELQRLKKRCCGLKLYLDHSTGNQKAPGGVIDDAFSMCAELNIPVVCHCEDPDINQAARTKYQNPKDIADHSRMRPPESEEKAMKDALALAKKYGTHLHIAHLSTKGGLDLIRAAKKAGVTVTCEVAPHHLFLTVDDYAALGTLAKMNPPLRTREHQEALWEGIADGTVDCISTDHAPHTLEEKNCDNPLKAPSGVPGTETMLPLLLSAAAGHWPHVASEKIFSILNSPPAEALAKVGQFSISDIARLCFENPNRIFNLGKQGIVEGATADFILVDPKKEWVIKGKELHSKCGWTPYEGWKVAGRVVRVVQS
ncbi:MAG: amidohydrolase family protein [Candidatus Peribacteraceae bacterium]|nr:amidohydrolase family protein [Candidatus Peribacteraceae bacterium]